MPQAEVHFRVLGNAGHIQLDRPKTLNALNNDMVLAITAQLKEWQQENAITHVVMSSTSPRAFCAGGDIRFARDVIMAGDYEAADRFFQNEYLCDLAVAEFGKPIVALCDGLVMGGGVGLAEHASHIVMTEKTTFAMPESSIGLFPDAGASLFFGRCPPAVARLLGMTGHIINGADCLVLGLATTVTTSAQISKLESALLSCEVSMIEDVIEQHRADPGAPSLDPFRQHIEHIFADDLMPEDSRDRAKNLMRLWPDNQFLQRIVHAFNDRCPMSIKLFNRLLDVAARFSSPSESLALDFKLAMRMIRRPDFVEGIRAVIVDKDRTPRWTPSSLEDVDEAMLECVFDDAGLPPLR